MNSEERKLAETGARLLLAFHMRERGKQEDIDHLAMTGDLNGSLARSVAKYIEAGFNELTQKYTLPLSATGAHSLLKVLSRSVQGLQDAALRRMAGEEQLNEEE